ncbi:MAG: hypothetical protein EOO20_04920 [Chryseobacterium sp.]|nr:MAG: hypothetical protein EOO20_04920 [Chryseobacterium sp.]
MLIDNKNNANDGILMVRYKMKESEYSAFEHWEAKIDPVIRTFEGFVSLTVLYPAKNSDFHYIIVRFDSSLHATAWIKSKERSVFLNDPKATWMGQRQEVVHEWEIFWYSTFRKTKKWKQWAVTFSAVYPLTVLIPLMVGQIANIVPLYFFEGILRALFISGFMTFLVMPFVLKLVRNWLHR